MKKNFEITLLDCEAKIEMDGYINKMRGKNLNLCDDLELQ